MTLAPVQVGQSVAARGPATGGGSLIPPPGVASFGIPGPYVYDVPSARRIPAVGRAIQLYGGLVKQMPIDAYRGFQRIAPAPRICTRPDPDRAASWFVQLSIEDYLLAGNTVSLVTARGADGWPLSVQWLPINYVYIVWDS